MKRIVLMLALVIAGEIVFGLVFNVPRFFRPTMLQVFEISNTQLGDMFAVYGVAAMIAYFPGGALADRFSVWMRSKARGSQPMASGRKSHAEIPDGRSGWSGFCSRIHTRRLFRSDLGSYPGCESRAGRPPELFPVSGVYIRYRNGHRWRCCFIWWTTD